MKVQISPEILEVMETVHYRPSVSIILPIKTKVNMKIEFSHTLKTTLDRVERELRENYTLELCIPIMEKLQRLAKEVNFNSNKKSVAIYVSPVFEKIIYLDKLVEERVIIDESFEIRDLVYNNKQLRKFLVILLSENECRLFLANSENFVRITSNLPKSVHAYHNDIHERVTNISDPVKRNQVILDKYLQHIDNALDKILITYHLPIFVLGSEKLMGQFRKHTKHNGEVVDYIHGNFEEFSLNELKGILEPYLLEWKRSLQNSLLNEVQIAANENKLATGIFDVWHEAMNCKGRLLIVERSFMFSAYQGAHKDIINSEAFPSNKYFSISDAVDDIIEIVMENGGDVEFVSDGAIKEYQHIALIMYY